MLRVQVNVEHPEPRKIAQAVDALERGDVIAYPTDTVYALGCDYSNRKAVERVYELKRMDRKQPLAFLLPDLSQIARFGHVSNVGYRLMKRLVPGPYTFILEATSEVPRSLLHDRNKRKSVGVRVPDNRIVQALLAAHGRPIMSTSAIDEEGEALGDPSDVKGRYERGLGVLVDGGYTGTEASTVLAIHGEEIEIVRAAKGRIDHVL